MTKQILVSLLVVSVIACGGRRIPSGQRPSMDPSTARGTAAARIQQHGYPKLANQLQMCCGGAQLQNLLEQLHFYDIAVIEADMVHRMPQYLGVDGILRSRNPNLVLLTYFSAGDVNPYYPQPVHQNFIKGMQESWYLRDTSGNPLPFFKLHNSGWTMAQNPSSPVQEFLPKYLHQNVLQSGMVDGIFYDWAVTYISWLNHTKPRRGGPIDIDNDGKGDSDQEVDDSWIEGMNAMFRNSRKIYGEHAIIMGNGGWNTGPHYVENLNGIMIEQFTEGEKGNPRLYGWRALMRTYAYYQKKTYPPRTPLIMANDDKADNFQFMRFALTSALMFDGYFCFTNRTGAYRESRWYDEYSVALQSGLPEKDQKRKGYLGNPIGKAYAVSNPKDYLEDAVEYESSQADTRVWRRDFENGIVLVNPSKTVQKAELKDNYKRIQGKQDPKTNDGSVVSSVTLGPKDGVILLKVSPGSQ